MIANEYGKFTLVCDNCGEEIKGFETWDDALDYIEEEGWEVSRGQSLDLVDGLIDICPNCSERKEKK